jgi:hypothetical protein
VPTYATADDVAAYIPGLVIDDAAGFDELIERAERDVDRLLGAYPRQPSTGLKLEPSRLYAWQAAALARAVSAQAEYLLAVGPDADVTPSPTPAKVSGPDFAIDYVQDGATASAGIAPKVARELEPLRSLLRPRAVRARP